MQQLGANVQVDLVQHVREHPSAHDMGYMSYCDMPSLRMGGRVLKEVSCEGSLIGKIGCCFKAFWYHMVSAVNH